MEQHYINHGGVFKGVAPNSVKVTEKLPAGTYTVGVTMEGEFLLKKTDNLTVSGKVYGADTHKYAERILSTYESRPKSTGVMLSGLKGTGKTTLSKMIAQHMVEVIKGIVILVSTPFSGEKFNQFLADIDQPCVVLFDEFEKTYEDNSKQNELLTLFDGVSTSKKLFILTCNDRYKVSSYMQNRPGRIFYMLHYTGLEIAFVQEYCDDNLKNKDHLQGVLNLASTMGDFSFDMLASLVEEMNRYGENATAALKMMNINPGEDHSQYTITVMRNGAELDCERYSETALRRSPVTLSEYGFAAYPRELNEDDKEDVYLPNELQETEVWHLSGSDIIKMNAEEGVFVFKTDDPNTQIVMTRKKVVSSGFDYELGSALMA